MPQVPDSVGQTGAVMAEVGGAALRSPGSLLLLQEPKQNGREHMDVCFPAQGDSSHPHFPVGSGNSCTFLSVVFASSCPLQSACVTSLIHVAVYPRLHLSLELAPTSW